MPTIILPLKVHNHHQLKIAESYLNSMLKGLKVNTEISKNSREWLQVKTSGADQTVAVRYLQEELGECPTPQEQIEKFSTFKGYISNLTKTEIKVDIGLPPNRDLVIPLESLQEQLVQGRKMALKKIAELFGLCLNLPLVVEVNSKEDDRRGIEGRLTERQLAQYRNWTKTLLDRVIVLGASLKEVKRAVRRTGSKRDVIDIESFSFLEHNMICKLGTDAAGLIPKIGRKLPNTKLATFNSKSIWKLLGDYRGT